MPTSSQHTLLPARAIPSSRLSFRHAVRFVHPFPAAAPSFPRRSRRLSFRRSRAPSVGGEPNHALQRTGTGVRVVRARFVLRRRCLVAELEFVRRLAFMAYTILFLGLPVIGVLLYRQLLHAMSAAAIVEPPRVPLFFVFAAYGAVLLFVVSECFRVWSGMHSLAAVGLFVVGVPWLLVQGSSLAPYLGCLRLSSCYDCSEFCLPGRAGSVGRVCFCRRAVITLPRRLTTRSSERLMAVGVSLYSTSTSP